MWVTPLKRVVPLATEQPEGPMTGGPEAKRPPFGGRKKHKKAQGSVPVAHNSYKPKNRNEMGKEKLKKRDSKTPPDYPPFGGGSYG